MQRQRKLRERLERLGSLKWELERERPEYERRRAAPPTPRTGKRRAKSRVSAQGSRGKLPRNRSRSSSQIGVPPAGRSSGRRLQRWPQ